MKQQQFIILLVLMLALIPVIASLPHVTSDDYGGDKGTTSTTTSATLAIQVTSTAMTSVPENADPILPILFTITSLTLFYNYKRNKSRQ